MDKRILPEALVKSALRRIDREFPDPAPEIQMLVGGSSGSFVCGLNLDGGRVVLKVTPPGQEQSLMERAHREVRFYRDLAEQVPLSVPRVLGLDYDEARGATVLVSAYEPALPPERWTKQDYIEVARQLGRFHAAFWSETATTALPGWLRAKSAVTAARCRDAAARWRMLSERADLHDSLEPYLRKLRQLLVNIPALEAQMATLPPTLCHGDCHTGNLLRDSDGEWIWADWQEVRFGPGVDDLSFLWERAFAASEASPPYDAMVQAYVAGLAVASLSPEEVARNLAWAELKSWLVEWPGYLGFLPATSFQRVLQRIATLIDRSEIVGDLRFP